MDENLYILGKKVAGGYPDGRYAATKTETATDDIYRVVKVLEYPSVRAVANKDAWSNAEVWKFGKVFFVPKADKLARKPEVCDGVAEITEDDYRHSLYEAIQRAKMAAIKSGDMEAAKRLYDKQQDIF